MTRAVGIELTKYQLGYNPESATRQVDFVIQRVSYGMKADELLEQLFVGVSKIQRRGAYHYFSSNIHWREQADRYLELIHGRGYLFHELDWESAYNNINQGFAAGATEWMKYVTAATLQPVHLYTNPTLYRQYKILDARCENFPLHIAQYFYIRPNPQTEIPKVPAERKTGWRIHQYVAGEHVAVAEAKEWGCANGPELDVFNGTLEEFDAMFKVQETHVPVVLSLDQRVTNIEERLDRAGIQK